MLVLTKRRFSTPSKAERRVEGEEKSAWRNGMPVEVKLEALEGFEEEAAREDGGMERVCWRWCRMEEPRPPVEPVMRNLRGMIRGEEVRLKESR